MADLVRTTRRSALATLASVATTNLHPRPANSTEPFAPEPSWLGRRFLRYISMHKWLQRAPYQGDAQQDAIDKRVEKYNAELSQLAAEILARPVQSIADMVDRLILAAHETDPSWDVEHANMLPVIGGALAAAGILPGDCMVGEAEHANALTAGRA